MPPMPADLARSVAARVDHGNTLYALGQWEDAAARYREALELVPDAADIHFNLANALVHLGALDEAVHCLTTALAFDPGHAGAHTNLGNLLRALGRAEEALEAYRHAVRLRPADPALRHNVGTALADLGRVEEARVWFAQAAGAEPPWRPALAALGTAQLQLGDPAAALVQFRRARAAGDAGATARLGEGLALLTLGRLGEGWAGYEARPVPNPFQSSLRMPRWDGSQPLAGRTILVWAEQGHGDSIQFARYLPRLSARGARVVLAAPLVLHRLLGDLADQVVAPGASVSCDLHCPLPSLPRAFGTELATIPADIPYVAAEPALAEDWESRLGPRPRIGIAWAGNPAFAHDRTRSLAFAALAPLLAVPGLHWHVLQKEIRPTDVAPMVSRRGLALHGPALDDFADTAALVDRLDLVISVDTAVAHLAGAMGRPCWVMLPHAADFRWLRDRDDSPWYPTLRLFRQPARGDWGGVLGAVAAALRERFAAG